MSYMYVTRAGGARRTRMEPGPGIRRLRSAASGTSRQMRELISGARGWRPACSKARRCSSRERAGRSPFPSPGSWRNTTRSGGWPDSETPCSGTSSRAPASALSRWTSPKVISPRSPGTSTTSSTPPSTPASEIGAAASRPMHRSRVTSWSTAATPKASSIRRRARPTRTRASGPSTSRIRRVRLCAPTTASRRSPVSRSAPGFPVAYRIPLTIIRICSTYGPEGGAPADRLEQILRGEPIRLHPDVPNNFNPIYEDDYVVLGIRAMEVARAADQRSTGPAARRSA